MATNTMEGGSRPPIAPFFHTKKRAVMRASCNVRIRKERPSKSGTAAVYLQININGQATTLPLQVSWPVEFFDNVNGKFLPRFKEDALAYDYNLEATKEVAKCNEIFIFYRHSDANLTIDQFHREIRIYGARKNFVLWAGLDVDNRYDLSQIEKQSWKNDRTALKMIRNYREVISFAEIDKNFLESMQAWMSNKKGLAISTVWRYMQTALTYIRRADSMGIGINMKSVDEYKLPTYESRIVYLKPTQIEALKTYYTSELIPNHHKRTLGQFLFSCHAGLRFSDIERVSWANVYNDMLVFEPWKTRKLQKVVNVPLFENHFQYFQRTKGKLFDTISGQKTNEQLKDIAIAAGVRVHLTTHVARHTFATEFLRRGGRVEVLQKLMGHKKIETTMKYVHVDEERLRFEMKLMAA